MIPPEKVIHTQIPVYICLYIYRYVIDIPVIVYQWNSLIQGVTMTYSSPAVPQGLFSATKLIIVKRNPEGKHYTPEV